MALNLMSAKEANKIHNRFLQSKVDKNIKMIVDDINNAIEAGKGKVTVYIDSLYMLECLNDTINKIASLGYEVSVDRDLISQMFTLKISWENYYGEE